MIRRKFNSITVTTTITIVFHIRCERRFLIASCALILDSCSATSAMVVSPTLSLTWEPRSSLTLTSRISATRMSASASGTDNPFSHFETVCRAMFNRAANSSCVSPLDFLKAFRFSFSMAWLASFLTAIINCLGRCIKQRKITNTVLDCFFSFLRPAVPPAPGAYAACFAPVLGSAPPTLFAPLPLPRRSK